METFIEMFFNTTEVTGSG